MLIYLDIETIPAQDAGVRAELALTVKPPGTLKKAESIAAWERDERAQAVEDAWLKTGLDGTYGQVWCIGWAIEDEHAQVLRATDFGAEAERDLLKRWTASIQSSYSGNSGTRPTIVGHNIIGFDLPFLWRRAIIRSVKPPFWLPRNPKPWSDAVIDTMLMWAGDRGTIGLDRLARALGENGKAGMTGADVWPALQAGRAADVAAYCADDVELTRRIHKRLVFA